jgi:transformation/transcription domain-associated protein
MANFLIRLKVLLADPKVDSGSLSVEPRLAPLFRTVASRWTRCTIRPIYFEKVVSMCKEDNAAGSKAGDRGQNKTKTSKNTSNSAASGSKVEDGKRVTSTLLSACLDIFIVLAEEAPDNDFLSENTSQINEIIVSCFRFARKGDGHELREKLRQFVVRFLSSGSKSARRDGKALQLIKVLLEEILVDAEIEYRKSTSSSPTSPEPTRQGARVRPAASEEEKAKECSAVFALEIIKEVGSIRTSFFKAFLSSLLALLGTLVKKHTAAASAKQKQGGVSYVPQAGTCSIRQMHHTPLAGILNESCSMDNAQSPAVGMTRSGQAKDPYPINELKGFDETMRCTVIILEILGSSDMAYSFTQSRKVLFQTISSILDSSNNVQLLMTAVRVVGKWLLSDISGGPLTVKERNSFLWKIASFDFNGLPDVVSQPLADLVSHYVISFLRGRGLERPQEVTSREFAKDEDRSTCVPQRVSDSDDMIMGRSLVACLLSANHALRDVLLSLYISQTSDAGRPRLPAPRDGIPVRAPVEVLWQLYHSDFEGLGGRHWIVVFVELLLANVRPVGFKADSDNTGARHGMKRLLPLPRKLNKSNASSSADSCLVIEYQSFCETLLDEKSNFASGGARFTTALRRLAHGDVTICQSLFQTLLPASWKSVPSDGIRLRLVPAMESLLSRPFHSQFLKSSGKREDQRAVNVIRSFLNGVAVLKPLPTLDLDLLVSLAETYNCWYEVLSILEDQYLVLSSQELSNTGCALRDKTLLAMRHIYRQLGESNTWMSLALESCDLTETKRAASLDVHGMVDEALETYTNLVELVESGTSSPSDFEMKMWEERWVELHREQCQLSVVSEYANASENSRLMLECAWKEQGWDRVRSLCSSSSLVADVESGEPALKMSETLLAVADGKLSDVENLHAQTAQLCLYRWQLLPDLTSASLAHASLLHYFHRLVEIRESGQIMVETSNHSNGKTLPDLKNLLK